MLQVKIDNNKIFLPLKNIWVAYSSEEELKQEFIVRLVNSYGYSLEQLDQDVQIKRHRADIAIWKSIEDKIQNRIPSIIIAIECKAEHIKIKESDYSKGYSFASSINASFFIAVNQKETKVFHVNKKLNINSLEKISDIPKAEILSNEKQLDKYIKEAKAFTHEEFTKILSRCHNIIRNNDKLSPEAAFDEISKILFMKIMFERESTGEMIFSLERFQANKKDDMHSLFNRTKETFESDEIFDHREQIKIKQSSFELIVKELESFNLSDTSDDVKGIAFEKFLGKTFRGELGQFFTPRTIVEYMINILDPQEGELICDPCCGSGGFLIVAFDYVRNKIDESIKNQIDILKQEYFENDYDKYEKYKRFLSEEFNLKNNKGRYYNLAYNCIFGTDANPRMARTAKMNMIMHGDGHGGVHHRDGLLNIDGIFENRFDIILTNPPFGARVDKAIKITEQDKETNISRIDKYTKLYGDKYLDALNQINNNINKSILSLYELGEISNLTEVLFIERCLNLLRPGGRMGIVLPEGILNNAKLQKVRDYVEGRAKIINITSIPQDVFIASGATIKPSLLFFKKFTEEESYIYNNLKKEVTYSVNQTYKSQLSSFNLELKNKDISKDEQKVIKNKQKQLLHQIEEEIKIEIKEKFNYEIPIIEVEKAGVSTTGAAIENELLPVSEEFKQYREKNKLWEEHIVPVQYDIYDGDFKRLTGNSEPQIFYKD